MLLVKYINIDASRTTPSTKATVFSPTSLYSLAQYHRCVMAAKRIHVDMIYLIRYEVRNRILNL